MILTHLFYFGFWPGESIGSTPAVQLSGRLSIYIGIRIAILLFIGVIQIDEKGQPAGRLIAGEMELYGNN
jgi:hypothetical protein